VAGAVSNTEGMLFSGLGLKRAGTAGAGQGAEGQP
jgi:hypothetical protein